MYYFDPNNNSIISVFINILSLLTSVKSDTEIHVY